MREIEFRGKTPIINSWDKRTGSYSILGKWIYGTPEPPHEGNDNNICMFYGGGAVRRETVGQYTGLKDKNCVKIFEGDILRKRDGFIDYKIFVRWDCEHCGFVYDYMPSKYAPHDGVMTFSLFHFCSDEHEIIGNIHDTPELLREGAE
jgi:hypothetical protein